MNKISKVVSENNPELCKYLKTVKDKAKKSSIITYYLQTIECNILEELFNYCRKNGIVKNICVLSNDGIMIPKDNYRDSLWEEFNEIVKSKFNIDIKFINKSMEQGYSDELIEKNLCQTEIWDKYFIDLSLASHHFLAKLFVDNNENNNYIYNVDNGWYVYDTYNVLQYYGDKFPLSLSDNITKTLQAELKTKYNLLINTISPDLPKFNRI